MAIDVAAIQARRAPQVGAQWKWLRWLLAVVLIAAAVDRIFDLRGFLEILRGVRLLPPEGNWLLALTVPFVELAAGVCLLIGFRPLWVVGFAAWWYLLELVAVALSLWRGADVPAHGHVDVFARPLNRWSLLEAGVMAVLAWSINLHLRGRVKGILR